MEINLPDVQPSNWTEQSNCMRSPSVEDMFYIFKRNFVLPILKSDDLLIIALGNNIKIVRMNVMLATIGENITYNVERE